MQNKKISIEDDKKNNILADLNDFLGRGPNDLKKEILDTFKAKYVGCGIWYINHVLSANIIKSNHSIITEQNKLLTVYMCFLVYCQSIYCGICRQHASKQIKNTSISDQIETPDDNTKYVLFEWFFDFHKAANSHSGKNNIVTKNEYYNFFVNDIETKNIFEKENYTYEKIQVGMWHYFFLLTTKCYHKKQVMYIYYLILEFMPYLENKQRTIFHEFCKKHRFSAALNDNSLPIDQLCTSFFDWIYAMYSEMNSKSGIIVYPLDVLKNVYFHLDVCTDNCDK